MRVQARARKWAWVAVALAVLTAAPAFAAETAPAASAPAAPAAAAGAPAAKPAFETQLQKVSYSIGVDLGRMLKQQSIDVDMDVMVKGLRDALTGGGLAMTEEEMRATLTAFQQELMKKQAEAQKKLAEENQKAGEAFLAANKTKEGVVTLPSGLQYKILTAGTGPKPKATDTVECKYKGTLIDGTEFDNSERHGGTGTATFPVGGVIPGWTEALQLMPVGSRWQLFVPANLAYGARGAGGQIGPNATLIFEVELLNIKPAEAPKQPATK